MKKIFFSLLLSVACLSFFQTNDNVANVFIDGEHLIDYYYQGDRILKRVHLDLHGRTVGLVTYKYNLDSLVDIVVSDKNAFIGTNKDLELKYYLDYKAQTKIVNGEFKVQLPLQLINTNELGDICHMMNSTTKYVIKRDSGYKHITFEHIDKAFRFYPSQIEAFITPKNIVSSFELTMRNDTIISEKYVFDAGVLYRKYSWINKRVLLVSTSCNYLDNAKASTVKKIILVDRNR